MAVNHLTDGTRGLSFPHTTASVTPTSGAAVFVSILSALVSPANFDGSNTHSVSGAGGTWAEIGRLHLGRRLLSVWRGTGLTSGALSLSNNTVDDHEETKWSVDEITDYVSTGIATENTASGATSLAIPDVGTPDAGSIIFSSFGVEGGAASPVADAGTTLVLSAGGSATRTLFVFYQTAPGDDTPSITWTGSLSAIGIAFIVNVSGGGGPTAVLTGTAIGGITESDIVAGGKTIIITLTGDTFIPN